jgi:SAM-dependent methyltransferase
MDKDRRHYSYAVYARSETAKNFERERFGGPIGSYLRWRQEAQLTHWLDGLGGKSLLDVGAGTGRIAVPMARLGARVTAADASQAMLAEARRKAEEAGVRLEFDICDAMELPYPDQSFDVVVCLRVIMHVLDWRRALTEVCRCARETVVLDFPPRWALSGLQAPIRAGASLFSSSVQRFRLFNLRRVRCELLRLGFAVEKVDKLWVLPIALHKLIGWRAFTLGCEQLLSWLGLRALLGAPVTILARRIDRGESP